MVIGTPIVGINFKRLDRVQINGGSHVLIVTGYHHNRPVRPYTGVLENGHGREYVFGDKNRPVKLGTVTENHPALRALAARNAAAGYVQPAQPAVDNGSRAMILRLLDDVEKGDLERAKFVASVLREAGFKSE